jgi:hypothetical protein
MLGFRVYRVAVLARLLGCLSARATVLLALLVCFWLFIFAEPALLGHLAQIRLGARVMSWASVKEVVRS